MHISILHQHDYWPNAQFVAFVCPVQACGSGGAQCPLLESAIGREKGEGTVILNAKEQLKIQIKKFCKTFSIGDLDGRSGRSPCCLRGTSQVLTSVLAANHFPFSPPS